MELYSVFWKERLFARTRAESAEEALERACQHILQHKDSVDRSELFASLATEEEAITPSPSNETS